MKIKEPTEKSSGKDYFLENTTCFSQERDLDTILRKEHVEVLLVTDGGCAPDSGYYGWVI